MRSQAKLQDVVIFNRCTLPTHKHSFGTLWDMLSFLCIINAKSVCNHTYTHLHTHIHRVVIVMKCIHVYIYI